MAESTPRDRIRRRKRAPTIDEQRAAFVARLTELRATRSTLELELAAVEVALGRLEGKPADPDDVRRMYSARYSNTR